MGLPLGKNAICTDWPGCQPVEDEECEVSVGWITFHHTESDVTFTCGGFSMALACDVTEIKSWLTRIMVGGVLTAVEMGSFQLTCTACTPLI